MNADLGIHVLDHSMLPSQGAPSWETPHRQLAFCRLSVQACCHWRWVRSVHTRGWDRGDWSKVLYVNRTGARNGVGTPLSSALSRMFWGLATSDLHLECTIRTLSSDSSPFVGYAAMYRYCTESLLRRGVDRGVRTIGCGAVPR